MRKIEKSINSILSIKYKTWVSDLEKNGSNHPLSRTYYDDIVMDLYKCQNGVCAYTEKFICIEELYHEKNWIEGVYNISDDENYKRTDHLGELEHFDSNLKKNKYWLWDNLFMIDSTINNRKSNINVIGYLKPDLEDYDPKKYFEYDESTHMFIPNTDITNQEMINEIQYMIDDVLLLNHGVIKNYRRNFINDTKFKIKAKIEYKIDRFFTSVDWCLEN